jgi:hypothetical protein
MGGIVRRERGKRGGNKGDSGRKRRGEKERWGEGGRGEGLKEERD